MKILARALLIGAIFGIMLAVIMSYAAIDHNPQNEFVATDGRYTSDLYVLFGANFAMAAIPVAILWALSEWLLSHKD